MSLPPPPLPSSTANWHWKNKNCTRWGKEWFETELTTITVEGDEGTVAITKVTEVDGDIELGQRKSKLITIFDVKVALSWEGTTKAGTEIAGSLTIPEVSHEIICDNLSDFAYTWSLSSSSTPDVSALYALVRKKLPVALEAKFATFPSAIIDTHGKDVTVSADPSRTGTPAPTGAGPSPAQVASSSAATAGGPAVKPKEKAKNLNSATVVVNAEFQVSAADLFSLLTDEKRIPAWTRAPAQSQGKPGTDYSLFGGGVKGKYVSLTPEKEIVQTWALSSPTWPSGHEATLTTSLEQTSNSTKIKFHLAGVPTGMEEEIKRNLEGYYIHGFKSIGYVPIFHPTSVYTSSYLEKQKLANKKRDVSASSSLSISSYLPTVAIATLVLAAAFAIPYLSASSSPPPASYTSSAFHK